MEIGEAFEYSKFDGCAFSFFVFKRKELRKERTKMKNIVKELQRKEKVLPEASALLILRKKSMRFERMEEEGDKLAPQIVDKP